jgi:hypothetical protein
VKLQSGEPGWDITDKVLKIGDGNNLWLGLSAVSGGTGGPSLNPLTLSLNDANQFPNDTTMNLISTWDTNTAAIYNRTLLINDITVSKCHAAKHAKIKLHIRISTDKILNAPSFLSC